VDSTFSAHVQASALSCLDTPLADAAYQPFWSHRLTVNWPLSKLKKS